MASPAQILANRENAKLSTGPRTEHGKLASSRNASRHGLTGTQIVMPGEDAELYEDLRQGMHDGYQPANDPERVLVDQIAASSWRLTRALRVETAFLTKLAEGSDSPDAAIAAALLDKPKELARIQRYIAAAQNAYYKATRELAKLQKERTEAERQAEVLESYMEPQEPVGFVSQTRSSGVFPVRMTARSMEPAQPAARCATP